MPDSFLQDLPPVPPIFSTEGAADEKVSVATSIRRGVICGADNEQAPEKYILYFDLRWTGYNWLDSTFDDDILSFKLMQILD